MTKSFLTTLIVFVGSCIILPREGAAQTGDSSALVLDPLVITAAGESRPVSQTPGGTSVITEEDINTREAASLPNLLELTPGVHKTSDSTWGSDISIRGLSRESVIMLIDGCRVNTATDINARFGLIEPDEIKRIEILKGPISSLYGSGSTGGVVNVITRSGEFTKEPEVRGALLTSGMSNPLGFKTYGFAEYDRPESFFYGSQSYRNFDSFKDGLGQTMHNSQFVDYESKLKTGYKLTDTQTAEGQLQYYQGDEVGIPGSGTAPLPQAGDVTYPVIRRGLANIVHTYQPDSDIYKESKLNVYYQFIDRRVRIDNFPPASPLVEIKPEADHNTAGTTWTNKLELAKHTLLGGLDVWQRNLDSSRVRELKTGQFISDIPLPDSFYRSAGAFAEDSWDVTQRFTLSTGARADQIHVENDATPQFADKQTDDTAWNAHLGATVKLLEDLNVTVIGARGYRAASLEERYTFLDLGGGKIKLGNPDLEPESSEFFETGLHYVKETFKLSLSGFFNKLDDLIAEQVVDPQTIVNENINKAKIYGTEAEAHWFLAEVWQLYGNLAYAVGKDTLNDEDLPGIAPLGGLAGLRYQEPKGIWGYLELNFAAAQTKTPPGVAASSPWQTLNFRVGYDFDAVHTAQTVFAGVDNIFDENYRDYLTTSRGFTFNEPGRAFLAGYQVRF